MFAKAKGSSIYDPALQRPGASFLPAGADLCTLPIHLTKEVNVLAKKKAAKKSGGKKKKRGGKRMGDSGTRQ